VADLAAAPDGLVRAPLLAAEGVTALSSPLALALVDLLFPWRKAKLAA
jgi:hypothetical protein